MKTVAVFAKKLNEVSLGCLKRMVELLQERGWGVACEVKLAGILEREQIDLALERLNQEKGKQP